MTEPWRALQARYKAILASGVDPPLRRAGFGKSGSYYRQWVGGDLCRIIHADRPKIRVPGHTSFVFDCRFFLAAMWEIFQEGPWNRAKPEGAGILDVRIGYLCPEKRDLWWDLRPDDSEDHDARVADDLRRRLQEYVLPWFDLFQRPKDIGDYLSAPEPGPGRYRYGYREIVQDAANLRGAAIAYYAAHEFSLARRMLDLADRTVNVPQSTASNADLRRRLENLMAEKSGTDSRS